MTDHSNDPDRLSASEAARAIREGRLTVVELAEACLARCSSRPEVVAWAHLDAGLVRKEARRLDAVPMSQRTSPLFGVPIGIKDIFATKDMPTEYGSKRYEGHQIGEDARIVKLLRAKGCLIFGKSHCTEFACGPGHPVHPPTRNPHDIKRSPGASSSGSAAAVADYEVTLAIGTQTGGSIIVPASFCGIYAWKPTFNLLALGGAFSVAPSLDTLGFFSRSVDDLMMLAELFEIKTLPVKEPLHKPRIAWVPTSVDVPADEDALQVIEAAVSALERAGFKMKKISLPPVFAGGHKVAQTIFLKECVASFQAELAEGTDGITEGNLEMVEMGKAVSWEDYTGAREAIGHAREAFLGILDDGYDALLTLSASGEAPVADYAAGVPVYASIWTAIGVPVINLPGWGGSASMPIGLSLIGREHEDRALLEHARAVASVFE